MKKHRFFAFSIALCLSVLALCGCSSQPEMERLEAPAQEDFVLSVELQNDTVQKGESFVLECSLENTSGEDYYITHGEEAFSYTYNGNEEAILTMGVPEYFHNGDQLTRTMEISSITSGTITVRADFDVFLTPNPEGAFQPYTYSQDFTVTVE